VAHIQPPAFDDRFDAPKRWLGLLFLSSACGLLLQLAGNAGEVVFNVE
jgi:hypothetical protein